ncbi:hypothetical protein SCHPADRAFT_486378 [Schizopora paradoxa]|uniref:BTB domain-containing protein n=1 Tax=Schizopora paradoxa TaxID=27342 RepID=A0A0H2RHQ6_9AGAM|nr:hypothetical protein SCHPADRAFT_486378 [Schizopora paradoxa]
MKTSWIKASRSRAAAVVFEQPPTASPTPSFRTTWTLEPFHWHSQVSFMSSSENSPPGPRPHSKTGTATPQPRVEDAFISTASGGYSQYKNAGPDTDLVLRSSDNVTFHVHSLIISLSSSVLKDKLAVPRAGSPEEPIDFNADGQVLLLLLDVIYPGRGLLQDVDFGGDLSLLEAVGVAARKYEIQAALEAIRTFLVYLANIARYSPIHLYIIAYEHQFYDEAKILSTKTLECNLYNVQNQKIFAKADALAVFKLFQLRQWRKITLLNALSGLVGEKAFYTNTFNAYGLNEAAYKPIAGDSAFSSSLKTAIGKKPENHSSFERELCSAWGSFKGEVSRIFEDRPDGSAFFENGHAFFYDGRFPNVITPHTAREFANILRIMPKEIKF